MTTGPFDCLVYVDASLRGDWALSLAALLPAREERTFHLLATERDAAARPDLLESAALRLAGARAVRRVVRPGPPRRAVVAEAEEGSYGLVIVPPAGRNALQRMLKGSRVASVVRGVHAPVLVARRPPSRLDRVLAAVSGGDASEAVVAAAAELASGLEGHVDYLHVASEVALPFAPHDGRPHAPDEDVAGAPPDALHSAQAALARAGHTGALVVREGLVVDEVLDAFEAGAYDLLVVGASSQVEHPRLGGENVTQRIVLGCPGSVLVVHASRRLAGPAA
ncbi:MAG TPA: universal stress protein [Vicinamibacteria bacterium]|nr:universal stress protein [Vicinamibacteria bacterium]